MWTGLSQPVTSLRSAQTPGSLVLFVSGEPKVLPDIRESTVGLGERMAGMLSGLPGNLALPKHLQPGYSENQSGGADSNPSPNSDETPWHLPPAQMACLGIVSDAAEQQRKEVLVVDVNRPGPHRDLVDQYIGPGDVLPMLLRPDGARLEGQENFLPNIVRRFIAPR